MISSHPETIQETTKGHLIKIKDTSIIQENPASDKIANLVLITAFLSTTSNHSDLTRRSSGSFLFWIFAQFFLS